MTISAAKLAVFRAMIPERVKAHINVLWKREEIYWHQRSLVKWLNHAEY